MTIDRTRDDLHALERELVAARDEFMAALGDVDPALLTAPGLAGEWSARELLAHLGYWAGHAAEALHAASQGRTIDFGEDELDVDERNAVVARVAMETTLATVRKREAAAFDALLTALRDADPAWLEERVSYGDSIEQVVRDDGADHYREHTADIRAWFSAAGGDDLDDRLEQAAADNGSEGDSRVE